MPPSQKGTPFGGKDIAKAFFDLDPYNAKPSNASKRAPKPTDCSHLVPTQPPATNNAKGNNKTTFLTLPVEIRLQIYDLLLVSRLDRMETPVWAFENTDQKPVQLYITQLPQYITVDCILRTFRLMELGILRTCKQIYHEANPILYSQNIFAISEPEQIFRFIVQVGLVNFKLVRTLHIWVPWKAKLAPWLQLLHILAEEASGLRSIDLGWSVNYGFHEPGAKERGLGDSLDFVRALGKIQGLEKLVIGGYYAKNWPVYLEGRTGVRVRAICGYCREEPEELCDKKLEDEKELQIFKEYQQGTEDLIP